MADPPKEIVSALKEAAAAVEEAKVPDDLREAAFNAALTSVGLALAAPPPPPGPPAASSSDAPLQSGDRALKLAQALDVAQPFVEQVYDIEDDGVHLVIQRSKLDDTKKGALQELAYLLLAGRRVALGEEWVTINVIADAAHDMGVHDSNFSKGIGAIAGDGVRVRGEKTKRELKINQVGLERAGSIVTRITEAS